MYYGGIDAGGTTFKCVIADDSRNILARKRIPTTDPAATFSGCREFFETNADAGLNIKALGVASFGPVEIDRASPAYGRILQTPKPGWSGADLIKGLRPNSDIPVFVETDVNAAALAEQAWGAAQGTNSSVYITVGTGIGAGIIVSGVLAGRPSHPEFGHIHVPRFSGDEFAGSCPFHGDCLEGMASAPALTARFGDPASLASDHVAWELFAHYMGGASAQLWLTLRPEKIILGGGVMQAEGLIDKIVKAHIRHLNGYTDETETSAAARLSLPGLGADAGVMGALWLAQTSGSGES